MQPRFAFAGLVLLSGCSEVDVTAQADASITGARLLTSTVMAPTTGSSVTVAIPPTQAGSLLVVALNYDSAEWLSRSVMGTGVALLAGQRSGDYSCGHSSEWWFARDVTAGVDSLTVEQRASVRVDVAVMEFVGTKRLDVSAAGPGLDSHEPAATAQAPRVPAHAGHVVVSTLATCGTLTGMAPGSPFTPVSLLGDHSTAYYIAEGIGEYGGEWSYDGGTWNANSVAFR